MSRTTHLMTAEELMDLSRDGHRYELVKGELLTMSPTGEEHGAVTLNITLLLGHHVRENKLGRMYCAETGFKLETDPDTVLAPDLAFIRSDKVGQLSKGYRSGAPDLVVEVLSPGDRKSRVENKTLQWLALGTLVVWVINPQTRTVDVRFANGEKRLFTEDEVLTDDEIVAGFRVPVSDIFA